jgi:hypothetical protein
MNKKILTLSSVKLRRKSGKKENSAPTYKLCRQRISHHHHHHNRFIVLSSGRQSETATLSTKE